MALRRRPANELIKNIPERAALHPLGLQRAALLVAKAGWRQRRVPIPHLEFAHRRERARVQLPGWRWSLTTSVSSQAGELNYCLLAIFGHLRPSIGTLERALAQVSALCVCARARCRAVETFHAFIILIIIMYSSREQSGATTRPRQAPPARSIKGAARLIVAPLEGFATNKQFARSARPSVRPSVRLSVRSLVRSPSPPIGRPGRN